MMAEVNAGLQELAHGKHRHSHGKNSFSGCTAAGFIDCIDTGAAFGQEGRIPA
jgi:hypothetical protein